MTDDQRIANIEVAWDAAWEEEFDRGNYFEVEAAPEDEAGKINVAVTCQRDYFPGESPFGEADIYVVAHGDTCDGHAFDFWDCFSGRGTIMHACNFDVELKQIFDFLKEYGIPVKEPESLVVQMRVMRAGLRLVNSWQVNP